MAQSAGARRDVFPPAGFRFLRRCPNQTYSAFRPAPGYKFSAPVASCARMPRTERHEFLVLGFLRVILIPLRNFNYDVLGSVRHALAAEPRLGCNSWRLIQLV